jgi:hypothetical protein
MENITAVRRARLGRWFANRPYPEEKKSYISQLINGHASFGEKAARKLEQDFGIPHMSLDQSLEEDSSGFTSTLARAELLNRLNKRLSDLSDEKLKALAVMLDVSH